MGKRHILAENYERFFGILGEARIKIRPGSKQVDNILQSFSSSIWDEDTGEYTINKTDFIKFKLKMKKLNLEKDNDWSLV